MNKKKARLRRARLTRAKIAKQNKPRLVVFRTPKHIYAQLISACGGKVLAQSSTLDKALRTDISNGGNVEAAAKIGQDIAGKIKQAGVEAIAFDRSGFRYHGRIKALADAVRENGVEF
jgi:large subunit ribosomal protein L18